jgi:hypothetical protein
MLAIFAFASPVYTCLLPETNQYHPTVARTASVHPPANPFRHLRLGVVTDPIGHELRGLLCLADRATQIPHSFGSPLPSRQRTKRRPTPPPHRGMRFANVEVLAKRVSRCATWQLKQHRLARRSTHRTGAPAALSTATPPPKLDHHRARITTTTSAAPQRRPVTPQR